MKKDKLSQRIQATGIALGAIFAGAALLINSLSPANAAENPQEEYPETITKEAVNTMVSGGKYMAEFEAFTTSAGKQQAYIYVWNTETGSSKMYMWSTGQDGGFKEAPAGYSPAVRP